MRKLLLWNLLACLVVGCGTGHYEDHLSQRKVTSKFDEFSAEESLPGTKVSIRVSKKFGSPLADGTDAKRLKPGDFAMPGWKRTYEGFVKDGNGGEQPYYCYFGVVEGDAARNLASTVRNELGKLSGQVSEPTDFQGEKPDGRAVTWKKIGFTGKQTLFYKNPQGKEEFHQFDTSFDVYVLEEAGSGVVVAWRMPSGIGANIGLNDLARLTAGGVTVKP